VNPFVLKYADILFVKSVNDE